MLNPYKIKEFFSEGGIDKILQTFLLTIIACYVVILLFWFTGWYTQNNLSHPTTEVMGAASASQILPTITLTPSPIESTPTATPASVDINTSQIKNSIQGIVNAHPELDLGISYVNIKNDSKVDVNGNQVFTAASTAKVFIACLLLSQVETGKFTLNQSLGDMTVGQQLKLMINQSNNDSWAALMSFIGYQYQIPYAHSLGITTYNYDNNQISPNDMALLLYKLYSNKLLNASDTSLLLSYMQHTNNEDLIPPAVPPGVNVYHKYGLYDDNLHDVSIIDDGKNPFVLIIYSSLNKNNVTYSQRLDVFHAIVIAVEKIVGINTDSVMSSLNSAQTATESASSQ